MVANLANLYSPSLRTNFFPYLLILPSGKTTSCSPFSIRSIAYLNAERDGDNWFIEKHPSLFKNQPCIPFISDLVTINLQSFFVTLLPIAMVSIKPSHLDLWVGAKMIEEFMGIEKPLFNIFFFLKKNLKTTSWVTNIAINPNTGFILCQISKDSFFKFY